MRLSRTLSLAALAGAVIVLATPNQQAMAQAGIELGILTCRTVPGTARNFLIHSTVETKCLFTHSGGGEEQYRGESGIGLGLDLGWYRDQTMSFVVISATSDYRVGSYLLAGKYAGAEASATFGLGAGASVLVGGGEKNITLQPFAVETSTGAGLSAGLSYLFLQPGKSISLSGAGRD